MNIHKVTAFVGLTPALIWIQLFGWIDLTFFQSTVPFLVSVLVLSLLQYREMKREGLL